ncbi:uncharacterized protein (DUF1684 family) [Allocatelliglobosispora scoriae]|uniref:Uncharacterized protein (DUF1684 family) n=1 Tax=Allocatelliglobosispora scoriae TaxID=643052 RepID=A0A841BYB8_9ACTN|nr:DUF1684 domain-containing protein [Allocatelliglobosispora scoriae]MBB5874147.1 uncharacterized protein (DUF1684 family) [Allocatelliglobosispora scoriae]
MTTTRHAVIADEDEWVREWRRWHSGRDEDLRSPYGLLSLTGLHWLDTAPATVDGLPGLWSADRSGIEVTALADAELRLDGEPVADGTRYAPADAAPGITLAHGGIQIELIRRGDRHAVRVRDPRSPAIAGFVGIPAYPPSTSWVLAGRFEPFESPQVGTVGSVVDGVSHITVSRGVVRFAVGGEDHALTAFGAGAGLSIQFRDATSGVTTHAASRVLAVDAPTADGTVVLDFNRAANMPCAFTDFTTCPLPLPENTLPFPVEAGEQAPA